MKSLKQWMKQHERLLSLGALVAGFITDYFTLSRADLPLVNIVLVVYLGILGASIFLISLPGWKKFPTWIRLWLPLLMQFTVGNLFSGFFSLYFHSAALAVSWPFLLLLLVVLFGSEFGKKHYERFTVQVAVFYLGIFSFLIFHLPIVLGEMSERVFLLSGAVSLGLILGVIFLLRLVALETIRRTRWWLGLVIGGIFLAINAFYFTGVLPPIPLLLKDAGVYHSISRKQGNFLVAGESLSWRDKLLNQNTVHLTSGSPVYVYSAIFAPATLNTGIVHVWQYYDEFLEQWRQVSQVDLNIAGGRDEGYRSYSLKSAPTPGWWRVSIETTAGQVIGRQKFKVERAVKTPPLELSTL